MKEHDMPAERVSYLDGIRDKIRGKTPPGSPHARPAAVEFDRPADDGPHFEGHEPARPSEQSFPPMPREAEIVEPIGPKRPPSLKARFSTMAQIADLLEPYENDAAIAIIDAVWEQRAHARGDTDELKLVSRDRLRSIEKQLIDKLPTIDGKLDEIKRTIGAAPEFPGARDHTAPPQQV